MSQGGGVAGTGSPGGRVAGTGSPDAGRAPQAGGPSTAGAAGAAATTAGARAAVAAVAGRTSTAANVRVRLPAPLRELARLPAEVVVEVEGPSTQTAVLDALEREHPVLAGTVRDRATGRRRPFIRFFAGEADLSNASPDDLLPAEVTTGREPFVVVGAIAGG